MEAGSKRFQKVGWGGSWEPHRVTLGHDSRSSVGPSSLPRSMSIRAAARRLALNVRIAVAAAVRLARLGLLLRLLSRFLALLLLLLLADRLFLRLLLALLKVTLIQDWWQSRKNRRKVCPTSNQSTDQKKKTYTHTHTHTHTTHTHIHTHTHAPLARLLAHSHGNTQMISAVDDSHTFLSSESSSEEDDAESESSELFTITSSLARSELYVFVWTEWAPQSFEASAPRPTTSALFFVHRCFEMPWLSLPRPCPSAQPILATSL